ncbi:glyoxylate/hydroxypyruvate reductase A [Paroceanicella profunda]|uniref:Glyoxylate/hydroxypyruvate reductase A n=1 Tax=Paroceanicella profunda TaxID=2579971 RepID=A0A5B8FH31_9RHOB|nr:glyoxylate/hydroxypyruvate reductase A [Paroceanicella profunda]QDL91717.1 glyoxylate/hydroxypyruvate reductase A [Paroceanicella profunda]
MKDLSAGTEPVTGVYLSTTIDLASRYLSPGETRIRLLRPEDVEDPAAVQFALAWRPADDAFSAYPNLKLVSSIAAGVDSITNCPSLPAGAAVVRVRDEAQASRMAAFAAWQVVWHHRRMGELMGYAAEGRWQRAASPEPFHEWTVGILGYGLMGRTVARGLAALGYPVIAACRSAAESAPGIEVIGGEGAMQEVARRSKVLINLLPLTEATRDVLNAEFFAQMPKGAVLIQLGRGEHLVDDDLLAALDSGHLSSASLDVFRAEPLPEGHPYWSHPAITITPHTASDTTPEEVIRQLADAVQDVMAGRRPAHLVDPAAGY